MRILLLMRGAPGVGKSTFIKEHHLEDYTLSADSIRMMFQSPVLGTSGKFCIAQSNEREVWDTLMHILESRMSRGEFVAVDATNSKTSEINKYRDYAQNYRYRIYCVDFTDVPIEECKRRNNSRPELKRVPDSAIDKMYSRFETQKIPSGVTVLKPDELDKIWFRKIDLSSYKRIHHIGDLHGCCTVLKEYLKDGLKDDEFYIFCGDYIDRGLENAETLNYLFSIMDKRNVLFLEGNHERWIWNWANGEISKSKEFETRTKPELNENVDPKTGRIFYRRLAQCAYYTYDDKTVFVSHAGISTLPKNLSLIASEQMIKGVGKYGDYLNVAHAFEASTDCIQVFGHRNTEDSPIELSERTYNLEGKVEFGGNLRVMILSHDGVQTVEVKNNVFREQFEEPAPQTDNSMADVINEMRRNRYIQEKKYGNISSFNFTRDAFYRGVWNNQTVKARGLFVDTARGAVVARSYQKFFNMNERPETNYDTLPQKLKYPVTAYVKENGFLGLVSYNEDTDDFFISSKTNVGGIYAEWFKNIFMSAVNDPAGLKAWLKENNSTMIFECIDPVNDPHIIKYDEPHAVLLDIVKNDLEFQKLDYADMKSIGERFGFQVKKQAAVLNDWPALKAWIAEVTAEDYLFDGENIEGFVIEDSAGFMFKLKLYYYSLWKKMRWVAQETLQSGNFRKTGSLVTPIENHFFGWCKEKFKVLPPETPIIQLRDMFLAEQ